MKSYPIRAILWNDHLYADRQRLPDFPDDLTSDPTLSVGIVIKETDNTLVLASTIEPGAEKLTYLVILKPTIISMKKYGSIKLAI